MGTPVASTIAIVANRMQAAMAMPATCFSVMNGMSPMSVSGEVASRLVAEGLPLSSPTSV